MVLERCFVVLGNDSCLGRINTVLNELSYTVFSYSDRRSLIFIFFLIFGAPKIACLGFSKGYFELYLGNQLIDFVYLIKFSLGIPVALV